MYAYVRIRRVKREVLNRSAKAAARVAAYRAAVDGVEAEHRADRRQEGHVCDNISSAELAEGGPSTGTSANHENTCTELPFPSFVAPRRFLH